MITVVIPLHNGGHHFRQCIASLAAQDAAPGAFELVVLENCSTDRSLDSLTLLPDRVPRRVLAADRLLPVDMNWRRTLDIPNAGEFITILGHDDAFDPHFVRTTTEALRSEPDAQVVLPHFRLIAADGSLIRPCFPMAPHESVEHYLAGRLANIRDSFGTGYVARSRAYWNIGGIPPFPKLIFADDALWMKLAEPNGIRILPQPSFSYRLHATSVSHNQDSKEMLSAFSDYLSFVLELAGRDPRVRSVFDVYGPEYVRRLADGWMYNEAERATSNGTAARPEVLAGWRAAYQNVLAQTPAAGRRSEDSFDLALALWINGSPARRRLWRQDGARRVLRALFRASRSWA